MKIFRAVPKANLAPGKLHSRHAGSRLPGNLPYFLDNLWEYTRPPAMPSRRQAVFASPTTELAIASACPTAANRDDYIALEVRFHSLPKKLMQLSVKDARYHKDVSTLQKFVNKQWRRLEERTLESKLSWAPFFLPGTSAAELSAALAGSASLRALIDDATGLVRIWDDAPDIACGEISFELEDDNFYTLWPVSVPD